MPLYENVFIARQDVSATQVDGMADKFAEILKEHGGEVTKKEYWGLKNLAYRIKKNRKGHYILLNIDAPSDAVLEMERNMRINEDVIRYLTVSVKELETEPSIMMRSKGGRDDRGPHGGRRPFGSDRGGRDRGGPDRGGRDRGGRDRGGPDRGGPDRGGPDRGASHAKEPDAASAPKATEEKTETEKGDSE